MKRFFRNNNDSIDFPPYLPHLKLRTAPFAAKVGSSFFYADAERTQYLDMLQHLTQYSEELLLVVGGEGVGKSALLEKYLERSEEHWRLCRINGEQGIGIDALFARLAECFDVDLATVETPLLLETLRQHLNALLGLQLSVLVIDDADKLSDDALEMVFLLAALEGNDGKLLRVLLFSDMTITPRLSSPDFSQLASPHQMHLQGMAEADSSSYLFHRLHQAGYLGASPFNADELRLLHQQTQGVPARLNQEAHRLLVEQMKGGATQQGSARNGLRVGVAATALVGSLLGMHDRINDLLGGTSQSSVAVTAERPVLRLADKETPWGMVIGDGESIQISCGTPLEQAVAVKPLAAAVPLQTQPVMKAALIQPINEPVVVDEGVPEAVQGEIRPSPDESLEKIQQPVVMAKAETGDKTPLVIKPQLPSIVPELPADLETHGDPTVAPEAEAAVDKKPQLKEALTLKSVSPDPVVGSDRPQTVVIKGRGLEAGGKVAVSWNGKVKVLEPSQVEVRDPEHMALTLTTGQEAGSWAVQVSAEDDRRSNVLRFNVVVPEAGTGQLKSEPKKLETAAEASKGGDSTRVEAKIMPEPKAEPVQPVKKKLVEKKPEVKKKPLQAKAGKIKGSSWIATQPSSNYTLQLLASAERKALDTLVAEQVSLKGPLGSFELSRNGKRLHVLTQGSYARRGQAETAAKLLPKSLRPWIRDFSGIKKAMIAPSPTTKKPPIAVGSGIKDTAWVWSQTPGHYTIQLAGAGDEVALEAVMRGVSLPGELAVVQSQRNGKPWYTLIYGRFTTKEAAKSTVTRLPESLRKGKPWIRQFSAIQNGLAEIPNR